MRGQRVFTTLFAKRYIKTRFDIKGREREKVAFKYSVAFLFCHGDT